MSISPSSAATFATPSRTEAASATSIAHAKPSSSPATAFAPSSLRSRMPTRAPSAARRRAVAAPMPDAPPVTSAVFPLRTTRLSLHSAAVPPSDSATPVAVIGASGSLGFGLAVRFARAGVPVAIGSRDPDRAQETAARAQELVADGAFEAFDNAGAARAADTVILSVPFRNQSETLTNLAGALSPGQLLVDATVPLAAAVSGKATRMLGVWQGSAAEQAREM